MIFIVPSLANAGISPEVLLRSIAILNAENEPIGNGVIVNRGVILTNYHVLRLHQKEKLSIQTSSGATYPLPLQTRFLPHKPLDEFAGTNDFAFALFQDLDNLTPQEPIQLADVIENDNLTRSGWHDNEFLISETKLHKLNIEAGQAVMLELCVPAMHGLSGSPIFDSSGKLVALNRGDRLVYGVCPLTFPAYALTLKLIVERIKFSVPEAIPYLGRQFLPHQKRHSLN